MKQRKKILSLFISLCMLLTLLPTPALAVEALDGVQVSSANMDDILGDGTVYVDGGNFAPEAASITVVFSETPPSAAPSHSTIVLSDGKVYLNSAAPENALTSLPILGSGDETNGYTYTFNNLTIDTSAPTALTVMDEAPVTIDLIGHNRIQGGDSDSEDTVGLEAYLLSLTGSGSLTVTAGDSPAKSSTALAADALSIDGPTLTATAGTSKDSIGIFGNFILESGVVTATGGDAQESSLGIYSGPTFDVSGGTLTASGGAVTSTDEFSVSAGASGQNSPTITGGTVTFTGGPAANSYGIRPGFSAAKITGGTVVFQGSTSAYPGSYAVEETYERAPITKEGDTNKMSVTAGASEAAAAPLSPWVGDGSDAVSSHLYLAFQPATTGSGSGGGSGGDPDPTYTITSVAVTPAATEVTKGLGSQFSAQVTGTGDYDNGVTWSVTGQTGSGTVINQLGQLSVDRGETAATLTVTATSVADTAKSGTATVTVKEIPIEYTSTANPATIYEGQPLVITFSPAPPAGSTLAWVTESPDRFPGYVDTSRAFVNRDGYVSGQGTTTLTLYNLTEAMNGLSIIATIDGHAAGSYVTYEILPALAPTTYTLTVENGIGSGEYAQGAAVPITANAPESGKQFKAWAISSGSGTVDTAENPQTIFYVSDSDATVTATYEDIPGGDSGDTGSGGDSGDSGGSSSGGSGGGGSSGPSGGWNDIQEELTDLVSNIASGDTAPGETLTVEMKGSTRVPQDILDAIAGEDVNVTFDLGGGNTWTVNGQDVPQGAEVLNLGIRTTSKSIPSKMLNTLPQGKATEQFTLSHSGPFDATLLLSMNLGKQHAGFWANLYYYNEALGQMIFQRSARIAADGSAAWPFDHASSYAVVIDEANHTPHWINPFDDVTEDDWFYTAVEYVNFNHLMSGLSETAFGPNVTTSRGMIAQILYRQEGQPAVTGENPFSDVADTAYYHDAILWAAEAGIVTGYGSGRFGPDDPITREQLAAILWRYAKHKGYDVSVGEDTNILSYHDAFDISDYAFAPIQWACGAGILQGTDGSLNPQGSARRCEAAAMLQRFLTNP